MSILSPHFERCGGRYREVKIDTGKPIHSSIARTPLTIAAIVVVPLEWGTPAAGRTTKFMCQNSYHNFTGHNSLELTDCLHEFKKILIGTIVY